MKQRAVAQQMAATRSKDEVAEAAAEAAVETFTRTR